MVYLKITEDKSFIEPVFVGIDLSKYIIDFKEN